MALMKVRQLAKYLRGSCPLNQRARIQTPWTSSTRCFNGLQCLSRAAEERSGSTGTRKERRFCEVPSARHGSICTLLLEPLRSGKLGGFYDHLHLSDWPFSVVPRPEFCTFIAGRPQLDTDINELLRALSRRETSSIYVFWSWLGAGKTHSLYYLANRAIKLNDCGPPVRLRPVYTELPKSPRSFVDLYKAFVRSIDLEIFAEAFLELGTSPQQQSVYNDLLSRNPDLANALRVLATGTPLDRTIAARWLRGDALPLSEFRRIEISQRIGTSDLATQVLSSLLNLLTASERSKGHQGHRVIWLIDEMQRVQHGRKSAILDINSGLHSLFNASPSGLSLVLSFSGQPQAKSLPSWLGLELKDRIGVTRAMVLPPLQRPDALAFVADVLKHFRSAGSDVADVHPFTEEACGEILSYLEMNGGLRPRFVMDAFNAVLEKADPEIEEGKFNTISAQFAKTVLEQHVVFADEEEGEG